MSLWNVIVLAIVQGLAELLPVSSSAHVVVAEKLMGLDPASPEMTLLLVMLHTGTMFAVILFFWSQWRRVFFRNAQAFKEIVIRIAVATVLTGILGELIVKAIENTLLGASSGNKAEVEQLFGRLDLIAPALAAAGILILIAGLRKREPVNGYVPETRHGIGMAQAALIGGVQGLCLPFRGFSRSGATISTGMLAGVTRERAESFSFALAVVLTPPVVLREVLRLRHAQQAAGGVASHQPLLMSLLGLVFAFLAGLVALKWLSKWLQEGRWYLFGIYCLVAAAVVFALHLRGY